MVLEVLDLARVEVVVGARVEVVVGARLVLEVFGLARLMRARSFSISRRHHDDKLSLSSWLWASVEARVDAILDVVVGDRAAPPPSPKLSSLGAAWNEQEKA